MGEKRKKNPVLAAWAGQRGGLFPYLLPLLLFLALTASSGGFSVVMVSVLLAFVLGREPVSLLGQRAGMTALAVVVYCAVCLCSGLWSHFGSYAGKESVKTLIALSVFGIVLAQVRTNGLRRLLWALEGVLAVVALLCIDGSCWQVLCSVFSYVMELFGSVYPLSRMGYEVGVRITGIYSNGNVSAGILAFGLVIGLYLFRTEEGEKGRFFAGLALGVQALAFFLSFSLGAMGAFALTCLVYLLCEGKEGRLSLFLLMVESVLVTILCAFLAYPMLGEMTPVPLLLAVLCGVGIWALDRFAGRRLAGKLEGKEKQVSIAIAALLALMAVYAVLAMKVTGPVELPQGALSRAVALEAGDYTVTAEGADPQVTIYSQNDQQLMMHTRTGLYEGPLSKAAFSVPEDSKVVWLAMKGEGVLDQVTLSDGTKVPLGYKLLPGFAANRLQALWANQNFIQRLVFFRDGIELWSHSPLFGWGIGGVEGQLTSVQDFYYESKYIHNHFIQIMDEAGVVGLAAFLFLLGSALWLLLKSRKGERDPMFAMLAACMTMMVGHSMTEVVWSTQMYQVLVFVLLAVLIIRFQEPKPESQKTQRQGRTAMAALCAVAVVFGALQGGTVLAAVQYDRLDLENIQPEEFLSAMGRMDVLDVYNDMDYKVNRMGNALRLGEGSISARCAFDLMSTKEFDSCYYAAAYYYLPLMHLDGFFLATRTGIEQEASNPDAWNSVFNLYRQAAVQMSPETAGDFAAGVNAVGDWLEDFNVDRMGPIYLNGENQEFLNCVRAVRQEGLAGEAAYEALLAGAA